MKTTSIGRAAEAAVAQYLKGQGFAIIAQNWRSRWCEIDIIAQKAKVVYFVEVKYRSSLSHGGGFEYIVPGKIRRMRFAAEFWTVQNCWEGECRLYAAEVNGDGQQNIKLAEIY